MASRRYSQIDLLRSLACVMVLAFTICALGYGGWGRFSGPPTLESVANPLIWL